MSRTLTRSTRPSVFSPCRWWSEEGPSLSPSETCESSVISSPTMESDRETYSVVLLLHSIGDVGHLS